MHVAFVVHSLEAGGTVRQLVNLALGLRERDHQVSILRLFDGDYLGRDLEAAGVQTASAGLRARTDLARALGRGIRWLLRQQPDVVYGLHAQENLLALLAARLPPGRRPTVWGVRVDDYAALAVDAVGRLGARAQRLLARLPELVIANSAAGASYAAAIGVPANRVCVIPNGVDTDAFRPDASGRARVRSEWGVGAGELLVGTVARLEPLKGHRRFLHSARAFAEIHATARFVCVGDGDPGYRMELQQLAEQLGLGGRLIWAGTRTDMREVYCALDVATLLSDREGSPNAVAESMACGRPCVATDVGETASIVGDRHLVLPPDPAPLEVAAAWDRAVGSMTPARERTLRERIERRLGLPRAVRATEDALASLLPPASPAFDA